MGSEQQFCLKWNNHQSTIVAGFDTLLESGTLVDCTLAAEGQYLKAHKVVLSACSPYFELLLSQHDEKHPIVILKDVKFQELKAMVDYMYHGEVNISQDQLGALLKAAESLQIKGLSDSGGGGGERENVDKRHHGTRKQTVPPPQPPRSSPIPPPSSLGHRRSVPQPQPPTVPPIVDLPEDDEPPPARPPPLPRVSSSREGSSSPPPKRKRHRRRSSGGEESLSAAPVVVPLTEGTHETSSSSELPPQSQPAPSTTVPSIPSSITPVVPPSSEPTVPSSQVSEPVTETEMLNRTQQSEVASPRQPPHEMTHEPVLEPVQKVEPQSEVLLEPKSEYLEEDVNEDSVEDLTLDDDMDEMDHPRPGPSHGGEGSSSQGGGFAPWHVADQSRDEVFMAAQEAVGAHRDSQDCYIKLSRIDDFARKHLDELISESVPHFLKNKSFIKYGLETDEDFSSNEDIHIEPSLHQSPPWDHDLDSEIGVNVNTKNTSHKKCKYLKVEDAPASLASKITNIESKIKSKALKKKKKQLKLLKKQMKSLKKQSVFMKKLKSNINQRVLLEYQRNAGNIENATVVNLPQKSNSSNISVTTSSPALTDSEKMVSTINTGFPQEDIHQLKKTSCNKFPSVRDKDTDEIETIANETCGKNENSSIFARTSISASTEVADDERASAGNMDSTDKNIKLIKKTSYYEILSCDSDKKAEFIGKSTDVTDPHGENENPNLSFRPSSPVLKEVTDCKRKSFAMNVDSPDVKQIMKTCYYELIPTEFQKNADNIQNTAVVNKSHGQDGNSSLAVKTSIPSSVVLTGGNSIASTTNMNSLGKSVREMIKSSNYKVSSGSHNNAGNENSIANTESHEKNRSSNLTIIIPASNVAVGKMKEAAISMSSADNLKNVMTTLPYSLMQQKPKGNQPTSTVTEMPTGKLGVIGCPSAKPVPSGTSVIPKPKMSFTTVSTLKPFNQVSRFATSMSKSSNVPDLVMKNKLGQFKMFNTETNLIPERYIVDERRSQNEVPSKTLDLKMYQAYYIEKQKKLNNADGVRGSAANRPQQIDNIETPNEFNTTGFRKVDANSKPYQEETVSKTIPTKKDSVLKQLMLTDNMDVKIHPGYFIEKEKNKSYADIVEAVTSSSLPSNVTIKPHIEFHSSCLKKTDANSKVCKEPTVSKTITADKESLQKQNLNETSGENICHTSHAEKQTNLSGYDRENLKGLSSVLSGSEQIFNIKLCNKLEIEPPNQFPSTTLKIIETHSEARQEPSKNLEPSNKFDEPQKLEENICLASRAGKEELNRSNAVKVKPGTSVLRDSVQIGNIQSSKQLEIGKSGPQQIYVVPPSNVFPSTSWKLIETNSKASEEDVSKTSATKRERTRKQDLSLTLEVKNQRAYMKTLKK